MLLGKKFLSCQIFAFEELFLIFDIIKDRGGEGEWLDLKHCIKVCDFVHVTMIPQEKVLRVTGGDGEFRVKDSMSFEIKEDKRMPEKLEKLQKNFKDLIRPRVSECCERKGEYATIVGGPRSTSIVEEECGRCYQLLHGRINLGLRCPGCKKVYHKKCFEGKKKGNVS